MKIFIDDEEIKWEGFNFPAGEPNIRVHGHHGYEATIICKIESPTDLMSLLLATDVIKNTFNIYNIVVYIPYLPFSRQDRRCLGNECFGLKVFADIINSQNYTKVETFDVHSNRARFLINKLDNYSPKNLIYDLVNKKEKYHVILFPDEGAKLRYNFSFPFALQYSAEKKRDASTGRITEYKVPDVLLQDKSILIVDDICDGGATFNILGKSIKDKCSVKKLDLFVSHGIFSKGLDELKKYYGHIYTTDTITKEKESEYLTIYRRV